MIDMLDGWRVLICERDTDMIMAHFGKNVVAGGDHRGWFCIIWSVNP